MIDAGDARDHARKHQRKLGGAVGRKTGVTRSGGRVAANLDLEVQKTARVESPKSEDGKKGDEDKATLKSISDEGNKLKLVFESPGPVRPGPFSGPGHRRQAPLEIGQDVVDVLDTSQERVANG